MDTVIALYKFLVFGIVVLSPLIYCTYWEIMRKKQKKWIWTLLIVVQTALNVWFIFHPDRYACIAWILSIVLDFILGITNSK